MVFINSSVFTIPLPLHYHSLYIRIIITDVTVLEGRAMGSDVVLQVGIPENTLHLSKIAMSQLEEILHQNLVTQALNSQTPSL